MNWFNMTYIQHEPKTIQHINLQSFRFVLNLDFGCFSPLQQRKYPEVFLELVLNSFKIVTPPGFEPGSKV